MSLPILDRPLLLETFANIEAHPELWNQGAWAKKYPDKDPSTWQPDNVCGTAFCFAGHTLVKKGFVPTFSLEFLEDASLDGGPADAMYFIPVKAAKKLSKRYKKTGKWEPADENDKVLAPDKAQELLGLDSRSANLLFGGGNTLKDLRQMVAHLLVNGNLNTFEYEED